MSTPITDTAITERDAVSTTPGAAHAALTMLRRELWLAGRRRGEVANPLIFFLVVVTFFPMALGPQPELLRQLAGGCVWVAALLASLLSLERLFREDLADGTLEQWVMSGQPLPLLVLGKIVGHWLLTGLPVLLMAPLLAMMLNLPPAAQPALLVGLLLGTPVLSLLGAIGVALTAGLPRGGALLAVLVLPLYVPVLLFGVGAVEAALEGAPALPHLALLGSLFCLSLFMAPPAAAAAVRLSVR